MFPLYQLLSRYWWIYGLRGALAILFGLFLFLNSNLSLYSFVMAAGFFILFESLLLLIMVFGRHDERILMAAIESGVGVCLGMIVVFGSTVGSLIMPAVTSTMVPLYIGLWAFIAGLFGLIHAALIRSRIQGLWILVLGSIMALLFGMTFILLRNEGALSLRLMIATFALLYGLFHVAAILKEKNFSSKA